MHNEVKSVAHVAQSAVCPKTIDNLALSGAVSNGKVGRRSRVYTMHTGRIEKPRLIIKSSGMEAVGSDARFKRVVFTGERVEVRC